MLSRTLVTLIVAGCFIVAAAVLVAGRHAPPGAIAKDELAYGTHKPRYVKGRLMEGCFDEPAGCGLVVW
jgi:hypothetical protein